MHVNYVKWFVFLDRAIQDTQRGRRRTRKNFISLLTTAPIPHPSFLVVVAAVVKEDISEGLSGSSPLEMARSSTFKTKSLGFECICTYILSQFVHSYICHIFVLLHSHTCICAKLCSSIDILLIIQSLRLWWYNMTM